MAHTKSTIKRIKQSRKRHLRNMDVKSRVKTTVKKFEETLQGSDKAAVKEMLGQVYREMDKAVSKGILKKNTVSRKKARLAVRANASKS